MLRCIHCGEDVDEQLLICPNCKQSPTGDAEILPAKVYKKLRRDVIRSFFLGVFGPFVLLSFIGYFFLIRQGIHQAQRQIRNKVIEEFKKPTIQETVKNVAATQAASILSDKVNPELAKLGAAISEIEKARLFADKFREEYATKLANVEAQLDTLTKNNMISGLEASAIASGDRKAYDKLDAMATGEDPDQTAIAALLSIKAFYVSGSRTSRYELKDYSPSLMLSSSGGSKPNDQFTTKELLDVLKNASDWRARAVSAQLLANKATKSVPDALIDVAEKDSRLDVVKDAKQSFKAITRFDDGDVFKTTELRGWWLMNSKEVLDRLPEDEH